MPKPISRAERPAAAPPDGPSIEVAIVTLDGHLASTCERAGDTFREELPGLTLSMHSASAWDDDPAALTACHAAIATADIVIVSMLFMEAHIDAVLPALTARRAHCDAMVCMMSDTRVVRLTRMGTLAMDGSSRGPLSLLKKLRGSRKTARSSGAGQMRMLRRLPRILRFIPGTAQDLRAYFLTLQCWLAGTDENVATMVRLLVQRYAAGERAPLRDQVRDSEPLDYPDVGLYHPRMHGGTLSTRLDDLPAPPCSVRPEDVSGHRSRGTVGLLLMRSYVLAGNTRHYDAVIERLERAGLRVVPAFASGLDGRPAMEAFFRDGERTTIDCLISLCGFSLVGGPAYHDADAAADALEALDVPYLAVHASEFQTLSQWRDSARGLTPIESTLMIAIPELDGASGPLLFAGHDTAGRGARSGEHGRGEDMAPIPERVERLVGRVERLVALRRQVRRERRIGIVLFNFPPNAGATGTAAYLAVFESLFNTLHRLAREGYAVALPESVDALRERILEGNRAVYGTDANVLATVALDDHVRDTPWLEEIEACWGAAPGRHQSDGRDIHVLGAAFGNVVVGVQPAMGIEGDPMRLLFEGGFAPTHAFVAFYRHLQHTVGVDALLHFGTHGALEFMPGKQTGLSGECWPDRLIGDTPNVYLYAANNPSEGALARRRSAATLVSYLTPSVSEAGLYRGLRELRVSIEQWHRLERHDSVEAEELVALLREQAGALDLSAQGSADTERLARALDGTPADFVDALRAVLDDYESALIPNGLHVVGECPSLDSRADLLHAFAAGADGDTPSRARVIELLRAAERTSDVGATRSTRAMRDRPDRPDRSDVPSALEARLLEMNRHLLADGELDGIVHALDAGFIRPVPGGDVLRNAEILPTGRNVHGFDPLRLPTALAQRLGARHAELLLERHRTDTGTAPTSIAFVLWGTDNLKNEGVPIAQVLALLGARPRVDGYGRVCGAELIPLAELGRPRVDVLVTLSGIFRDLLPLQTRVLAEAAQLAAHADEPLAMNAVRRHALAFAESHGCTLAEASLRVFSNADGAYGANVNQLIDNGMWQEEAELADTYANRKCFAYGVDGKPVRRAELLQATLRDVDLAYQNLESVELGVTSLDHYFDTLGGINSMVKQARGVAVPVYIGDQTRGAGTVRSLSEQVALETRTRTLNPKWYEGMLAHGYEGVRHIEMSITNTLGWSATTGQVSPWVYGHLAKTFVLDSGMRERLATLNPKASMRVAARLLEAHERRYWTPDDETLRALSEAGDELEDRLEGVLTEAAA